MLKNSIQKFSFIKNRLTFKINISCFSCLFLFAKTQRLEGITSHIPKTDKHIILGDSECLLDKLINALLKIQSSYSLSNIYITSDATNSFRFWCANKVDFEVLNEILLFLKKEGVLDPIFYKYTMRREKATLRTSKKTGRPNQQLINVLESYYLPFPKSVEQVIYDTGVEKKGIRISLGDDD